MTRSPAFPLVGLIVLATISPGCGQDSDDAGLPPLLQRVRLVNNLDWVSANQASDPFERPDAKRCASRKIMSEKEFSGVWHTVATIGCDYASLHTTLLHDVPKGALVQARFFHFTLNLGDGGWFITLGIGPEDQAPETVLELHEPVPAKTKLIELEWTAARDYLKGERVWWNVANHGINNWSIVDLTAMGPFDGCPVPEDACAGSADCAHFGRCALGPDCTCGIGDSADCRASNLCAYYGQCDRGSTPDTADQCVATNTADCLAAVHCTQDGFCTAQDGECIAATNADCEQAGVCPNLGYCHAVGHGCVALSDDDCLAADACRFGGRCSQRDGACLALTEEDCKRSGYCTNSGRCIPRDGQCVTPEEAAGE